jgi:hypothetical protein
MLSDRDIRTNITPCEAAAMLPERKGIGLHARIEKSDGKGVIDDRAALPHQLIEPLAG